MTVRGFLTWYLGAVLFIGTAGAGGYRILEHHRAQLAAHQAAEAAATAMATPNTVQPEPPPPPASSDATSPTTPAAHQPAVASRPFPPLRPHLAASHHVPGPEWRAGRRTRLAEAERPAHHPRTLAAATRTAAPYRTASRYVVVPLRPPGGYATPPRPAVTYYAYPGYPPYPPGYGYAYAPGYPYYRVY
jgi:hypothetical protein